MRITFILGLVFAFVFGAVAPVLAQDVVKEELETRKSGIQGKVQENQQKLEESRERLRATQEKARKDMAEVKGEALEKRDEKRDEMKAKAAEFRGDIAKNRAEVAQRVFGATIERLEKLIERIESRRDKLATEGVNASSTDSFIALAKTNISLAKDHIGKMATTTSTREEFDQLKAHVKEIRELLVEAKQNLMKAVQSMKGLALPKKPASDDADDDETESAE